MQSFITFSIVLDETFKQEQDNWTQLHSLTTYDVVAEPSASITFTGGFTRLWIRTFVWDVLFTHEIGRNHIRHLKYSQVNRTQD